MPTLETHPSTTTVKLLMMGNSGSGKTSALAALAAAGYRLFIADFDNGLDILMDPSVLAPEFRKNVNYKLYQDKPVKAGNALIPTASAWTNFTRDIGDWKEDGKSLGSIFTWGERDVFVVDSITFASDRCFDEALKLGGRLGQRAQIQDYGTALDSLASFFELVYGGNVGCNVVMSAHLQFVGDEMSGQRKAYPNVIGQKLAPKLPRYFNNMILVEKSVVGATVKRQFQTSGTHNIDLKVSKPSTVPAKMEADLAKLFSLLKGESVPAVPAKAT
jgi:hypothetical protein